MMNFSFYQKVTAPWMIKEMAPEPGTKKPLFLLYIEGKGTPDGEHVIKMKYNPITDTRIKSATHELYIHKSVLKDKRRDVSAKEVRFEDKSATGHKNAFKTSSHTNTGVGSALGCNVDSERVELKDPVTGAGIAVSGSNISVGAPGKETNYGEKGMTNLSGKEQVVGLPEKSHVILMSTGFMRILPRAFVPPFCFPDYIPDISILNQITGTVSIFKSIIKELRNI